MSVLQTCKRIGRLGLEFVSETLRACGNRQSPVAAPHPAYPSLIKYFCNTLRNWLDLLANSFRSRSSNGRTEGLNHGLRAILGGAFGMANFENFRLRALHCFGLA